MTFQEAMGNVFDGKKIRRKNWTSGVYITCNTCGISGMIYPIMVVENASGERMIVHVYELTRMDFFSTNWEVLL